MWRPLNPSDVERIFTTESRQKDQRLFSLTHTPMKRLLVTHNRVGLPNNQFIGEQHLLELIQRGEVGQSNRVWFMVGETGSGKSELCQWLEYNLAPTHVPIHISRRQSNLTGILDVLNVHLPPVAQMIGTSLPNDILAEHLRLYLQLRSHREGRYGEAVQALLPYCDTIIEQLYNNRGNQELLTNFPELPEEFPYQSWLQGAVREVLGIQSLEHTLQGVVKHYRSQGRRPVLLLEDITTLGFLRDDLLDYLFDLSTPGFDAVIGLTTGFEHSSLGALQQLGEMNYVRDRLSARLQLTHESGETFFLNETADLHDLVRRYLSCLPDPPPQAEAPIFAGLYPFTPLMLNRLYLHLEESGNSRRTPRNLLDAVIKPSLSLNQPPHQTFFQPHPYLRPPILTFYQQGLSSEQVSLLYWHGELESEMVRVPAAVSEAFGLEPVPEVRGFHQPISSSNLFQPIKPPNDPQAEWQAVLAELQAWRSGDVFPKRQILKRGVMKLLQTLTDPRLVQHPHLHSSTADPLEYHRGSDLLPIFMPGSGDVLPDHWPSLHLAASTDAKFLEECATFGLSHAGHIEIFSDPGHTKEIAEELAAEFQTSLRSHLEHLLGCRYTEAVLGLWWLSQSLALTRIMLPGASEARASLLRYDPDHTQTKKPWQATRPHQTLHRTTQELLEHHRDYRALLLSVFHHRDDLLDAELFDQAWANFEPEQFIRGLSELSLKRLTAVPFRQYRSGKSLYELLRPAQEYCAALLAYGASDQDERDLSAVSHHLKELIEQSASFDRLVQRLEHLAQQLGLAVTAPPSSHEWRSEHWTQVQLEVEQSMQETAGVPPVLRIAQVRAWLEYLSGLPPLVWSNELRRFYALVHNMLVSREGGQRVSAKPSPQQFVSLAELEQLRERLQIALERRTQISPTQKQQLSASLSRLAALEIPHLTQLAQDYQQRFPQTTTECLAATCQLLDTTSQYLKHTEQASASADSHQ